MRRGAIVSCGLAGSILAWCILPAAPLDAPPRPSPQAPAAASARTLVLHVYLTPSADRRQVMVTVQDGATGAISDPFTFPGDFFGPPGPGLPPPPAPPVAPAPGADPKLAAAAAEYMAGVPASFRTAADAVAAGTVADVNALVAAVAANRQAHARALSTWLDGAVRAKADATGHITDKAGVAAALRTSAAALDGGD